MDNEYNFETFQRPKPEQRKTRSYRFSEEDVALIDALAKDTGLNHTRVIALAVRELAKRRKVVAGK